MRVQKKTKCLDQTVWREEEDSFHLTFDRRVLSCIKERATARTYGVCRPTLHLCRPLTLKKMPMNCMMMACSPMVITMTAMKVGL